MFNNDWKSWNWVKSPSNYTFLLSYDLNIYVLIRTMVEQLDIGNDLNGSQLRPRPRNAFMKRCVFNENAPRPDYHFRSVLPDHTETLDCYAKRNATSFICTCVNDVRDVSVFKSFRFRCPHFKCCHPGQRSNACVFDKNDQHPWFMGPKLNVGAIHPVQIIFTRTCRQFMAKKDWFIKLSNLTLLARTLRKPKGGKNTRPYVWLNPMYCWFFIVGKLETARECFAMTNHWEVILWHLLPILIYPISLVPDWGGWTGPSLHYPDWRLPPPGQWPRDG